MKRKAKPEPASIDSVEAETKRQLAESQALYAEALGDLNSDPGSAAAQQSLDTLEAEIDGHKRKLDRYAAARLASIQRNSKEARQRRHQEIVKAVDSVPAQANAIRSKVSQLLDQLALVGGTLAGIEQDKAELRATLLGPVSDLYQHDRPESMHSKRFTESDRVRRLVDSLAAPSHVYAAVKGSGLGEVGVALRGIEYVQRVDVDEDIETFTARAEYHLQQVGETLTAESVKQLKESN